MDHIFIIYSSVIGHLTWFHFPTVIKQQYHCYVTNPMVRCEVLLVFCMVWNSWILQSFYS